MVNILVPKRILSSLTRLNNEYFCHYLAPPTVRLFNVSTPYGESCLFVITCLRRFSFGLRVPHTPLVQPVVCSALSSAAVSFISNNYTGSELTAFITLTAGLLDIQVCSYSPVCVCEPAAKDKTVEGASESIKSYLLAAARVINPLTYRLLYAAVFSDFSCCLCSINSALSSQGELITIWRSVRISSSSMCARGSHTRMCSHSRRCRPASTRQSGSPATVSSFLAVPVTLTLHHEKERKSDRRQRTICNFTLDFFFFQRWHFSRT